MTTRRRFRLVVLVSGGGGLMSTLVRAAQAGDEVFEIAAVVSSRADAPGLGKAAAAGVPTGTVDPRAHASTESFNQALWETIEAFAPVDGVMLAGWLPRIRVPLRWQDRVINAHPGLLPWFGGKGLWGRRVHEAVLASGMKVAGLTFHFVDDEYDHGAIIQQIALPIADEDTVESLESKIIAAQHAAIVPLVRAWAAGAFRRVGRRVVGAPAGWCSARPS